MEIRYGIVATAAIAKRFVGAVEATNGKVVAVGSRTYESAKRFADECKIPKAYASYEELYQDKEVDVVYIATINAQHVPEIKKALLHGKHVLCEKPLGLNEKEVQEVFALAKEKNLFLMEMQKSVFLPITNVVKEYIDNQTLGQLHQIDMSASFASPNVQWMHEPQQGGVVYGSATYTFEYLDYLIEPKQTIVQTLTTKEDSGTIDNISMNIKMDMVLIHSRIAMGKSSGSFATFYFANGYITIDEHWKARSCQIHTNDGIEVIEKPVVYEMQYELAHVVTCLENGLNESDIMPFERTRQCVRIVDQIIKDN